MVSVKWWLDFGFFNELAERVNYVGFSKMANDIIKQVKRYVPQDTQTMLKLHRVDQNDYSTALYYGSPINDKINMIVIKQHQQSLRHYGTPGGSMREGISADIPGAKWAVGDQMIGKNKKQARDYGKGYREKYSGLNKYKTAFLKNALDDIVDGNTSKYFRKVAPKTWVKIIYKGGS